MANDIDFDKALKEAGYSSAEVKFYSIGIKLAAWDIASKLSGRRANASKWVLAGGFAFMFGMISSPDSFTDAYGKLAPKFAAICFMISTWFGFRCLISAYFQEAMSESAPLKSVLELMEQKKRRKAALTPEEIDESEPPSVFAKKLVNEFLEDLKVLLKGLKSLSLQILFFAFGVTALIVAFLFK